MADKPKFSWNADKKEEVVKKSKFSWNEEKPSTAEKTIKPIPKMTPAQKKVYAEELGLNKEPLPIPKAPTKNLVVGKGVKKEVKPQGKLAPKDLKRPDNPFAPLLVNALNTATLGAFERNTDAIDQLREKAPITSTIGSMAGYLAPFSGVKSAVVKGTQAVGKRIATDALVGAGIDTASELIKNKNDIGTATKNVAMGAALGVLADGALTGLGKAFKGIQAKYGKNIPKEIIEVLQKADVLEKKGDYDSEEYFAMIDYLDEINRQSPAYIKKEAQFQAPKVKKFNTLNRNIETLPDIPSKGKSYRVINTAYDTAEKKYNEAIETAQNYFGTNELRDVEMSQAKEILGIDFNQIVANMEKAEAPDIYKMGERERLKAVTGLTERPSLITNQLQGQTLKTNKPIIEALGNRVNKPYDAPKPLSNTIQTPLQSLKPQGNINTQPIINKALKPNVATPKATSNIYTDMQPPKSQIVSSKKNEKLGFWDNMKKVYARIVDTNNPIKDVDMPTFVKATNAKSVGGIVDYTLKEGLRDINGNKVGKSLREVVEAVPKGKENEFWDYMLHRNNIDRAREGKAVYTDYTSEMSAEVAKRFENSLPEYKKIGDDIVNWIDTFTRTWGVDAGTVNKEIYDGLKDTYKSYIPTNRDFSTLEDAIPQGVRSKFVDQKSPIKKATGSDRDIVNPVENIMNLVNRTIRTAKYNEVGQTLLESVRKAPDKMKQFAEEIAVKDGMFANTDNIVTIMENGKPTYLKINNIDLLTSLNAVPKQINNIKYISSAINLYKGLITQKNPIFAIRNIFRDIPTAYVYGSEKNPVKFGADLLKAGKEAVTNGEMLQKYKSVGGGGANFFNSGNVTKSASELTKKEGMLHPIKAIEKFNNLTETAPRLAEFTRVYEKTGDIDKALYAANDVTVNFSKGGDITKSLDKGVPYLNAGVQGLDKFFREVKNNPLQVITKAGISITTPTVALYLVNKDNPNYQELDNRTKDTYFLIPNNSDKDDKGNARTFIKLPKSRELGVLFSSLFERSTRAIKGEDKAFKGFANTVATNFSPTNPMENNILSPLAYNIPTNKDFAQRSIVPQGMTMDNRSPYLQYDEKTSEIAKKIGELTKDINGGVSPKQVDYIMKSYLGIIAQYGLPLNTKGSDPIKSLTTQFKADPIYSNQTLTDFYDNLDKSKRVAADKNITGKIAPKILTPEEKIKNTLNKASLEISNINKEIRKLDQVTDKTKIEALRIKILNIAKNANNMVK